MRLPGKWKSAGGRFWGICWLYLPTRIPVTGTYPISGKFWDRGESRSPNPWNNQQIKMILTVSQGNYSVLPDIPQIPNSKSLSTANGRENIRPKKIQVLLMFIKRR